MLKKIGHEQMGRSQSEWLNRWLHFSYEGYYDLENIHFGVLRVVNDDHIQPHTGFDMLLHENMEILIYVVHGQLTHEDSLGQKRILKRGEVQYMSAGSGIWHSERNDGEEELHLIQIWIFPDKEGYEPFYADWNTSFQERVNRWLPIASNNSSKTDVVIHQDSNLLVSYISVGKTLEYHIEEDRQGYLIVLEGRIQVNDIEIQEKDAMQIQNEFIHIEALDKSHIILVEMKKWECEN